MAKRPPPYFIGVRTYQDPLGRFSFRYPTDWHQFDLEDREGVMFAPDPNDLKTAFTAWVKELEHAVVAEDLDDLKAGVEEGLAQLSECHVESSSEIVLGNLIKFERVFTFREDGVTRKRKLWMLYVDRWLIVLIWQGADEEAYEHWLPMGNYAYGTFQIPEALWFATDRDLLQRNT